MRILLYLCAVSGIITLLNGCVTKTIVLDSNTDVVRLGGNVHGDIYYYDKDSGWTLTKDAKLPAGWYAGPMTITNF